MDQQAARFLPLRALPPCIPIPGHATDQHQLARVTLRDGLTSVVDVTNPLTVAAQCTQPGGVVLSPHTETWAPPTADHRHVFELPPPATGLAAANPTIIHAPHLVVFLTVLNVVLSLAADPEEEILSYLRNPADHDLTTLISAILIHYFPQHFAMQTVTDAVVAPFRRCAAQVLSMLQASLRTVAHTIKGSAGKTDKTVHFWVHTARPFTLCSSTLKVIAMNQDIAATTANINTATPALVFTTHGASFPPLTNLGNSDAADIPLNKLVVLPPAEQVPGFETRLYSPTHLAPLLTEHATEAEVSLTKLTVELMRDQLQDTLETNRLVQALRQQLPDVFPAYTKLYPTLVQMLADLRKSRLSIETDQNTQPEEKRRLVVRLPFHDAAALGAAETLELYTPWGTATVTCHHRIVDITRPDVQVDVMHMDPGRSDTKTVQCAQQPLLFGASSCTSEKGREDTLAARNRVNMSKQLSGRIFYGLKLADALQMALCNEVKGTDADKSYKPLETLAGKGAAHSLRVLDMDSVRQAAQQLVPDADPRFPDPTAEREAVCCFIVSALAGRLSAHVADTHLSKKQRTLDQDHKVRVVQPVVQSADMQAVRHFVNVQYLQSACPPMAQTPPTTSPKAPRTQTPTAAATTTLFFADVSAGNPVAAASSSSPQSQMHEHQLQLPHFDLDESFWQFATEPVLPVHNSSNNNANDSGLDSSHSTPVSALSQDLSVLALPDLGPYIAKELAGPAKKVRRRRRTGAVVPYGRSRKSQPKNTDTMDDAAADKLEHVSMTDRDMHDLMDAMVNFVGCADSNNGSSTFRSHSNNVNNNNNSASSGAAPVTTGAITNATEACSSSSVACLADEELIKWIDSVVIDVALAPAVVPLKTMALGADWMVHVFATAGEAGQSVLAQLPTSSPQPADILRTLAYLVETMLSSPRCFRVAVEPSDLTNLGWAAEEAMGMEIQNILLALYSVYLRAARVVNPLTPEYRETRALLSANDMYVNVMNPLRIVDSVDRLADILFAKCSAASVSQPCPLVIRADDDWSAIVSHSLMALSCFRRTLDFMSESMPSTSSGQTMTLACPMVPNPTLVLC